MRGLGEIVLKMNLCKIEVKKLQEEHSNMSQIDMLSGEGSQNRELTNKLLGEIKALEWVLNLK